MRTDNTANLITAAQRRHELTRSKTIQALHELDASGAPVTYQVVARRAQVSRSWLYTQPDIRAEIERLRDHGRRPPASPIPRGSAPPSRRCSAASRPQPHASGSSPRTTTDCAGSSSRHSANNEPTTTMSVRNRRPHQLPAATIP